MNNNLRKCDKCGSTDFRIPLTAIDTVEYSGTITTDGDIVTHDFLKDYCGETEYDYDAEIECQNCRKSFSWETFCPNEVAQFRKEQSERSAAPDLVAALNQMVEHYGRLHDVLSDTIEDGRLTEGDIPDDYQALVHHLSGGCLIAMNSATNALKKVAQPS